MRFRTTPCTRAPRKPAVEPAQRLLDERRQRRVPQRQALQGGSPTTGSPQHDPSPQA